MNKSELRTKAKNYRKALEIKELSQNFSANICKNILMMNCYKTSKTILAYFPFNKEINIKILFEDSKKTWVLPKIQNNGLTLSIQQYKNGDILKKNKFGVPEPIVKAEEINTNDVEMVILPALMADKKGYRLGYGAGFYDRFLPTLRKDCIKVIPVYEDLLIDSLPIDKWDIPADYIITQSEIIKT